ncbi:MAG: glutamate--cysteine ligase [Acidimicrobiia bacterium]|nr:glutamate--cysteine ligase [Acidimicrobiia bacterium]
MSKRGEHGRYARHGQQRPVAARNAAPLALSRVRLRQPGLRPVPRLSQTSPSSGSCQHQGVPREPRRAPNPAVGSRRGALLQIDFHSSAGPSLGVEMELEIVDVDTRELHSGATEILADAGRPYDGDHPKAKHELLESTIEIITGICSTVGEARADLEATLVELQPHLERRDLAFICSGTHPFSDWAKQQISPNPRYERLVEEMQWLARRLQIFGIHVHVGVRSAEKAIAIANALTAYIPHFLALSASSPYWMGQDTGLASSRSKIFEGLPTAGLPYQLSGWSEFEDFMHTLVSAKAISSIREVWWDIRPHPDFGTVELRICDGLPTMSEVASMAAISQCLVEWLDTRHDEGHELPVPHSWVVRENKWRAARHGINAELITDDSGTLAHMGDAIADLIDELTPTARRLGCEAELDHARAIVEHGPSYLRQRDVVASGGTLVDVVDSLIDELHTDRPHVIGTARRTEQQRPRG